LVRTSSPCTSCSRRSRRGTASATGVTPVSSSLAPAGPIAARWCCSSWSSGGHDLGLHSRLLLEYDGTRFCGWSRQPGGRSVQEEVERALAVVLRQPAVSVTVAGRTDAGVHALGQVASYAGPPASARGLNALLPDDVAVLSCEEAPSGFDARRHATSRAYTYRILARAGRPARSRLRALHWPQ